MRPCTAEGRVFFAYQNLENPNAVTEHDINNAHLLTVFKNFICHVQPGDARYTYHYRQVTCERSRLHVGRLARGVCMALAWSVSSCNTLACGPMPSRAQRPAVPQQDEAQR